MSLPKRWSFLTTPLFNTWVPEKIYPRASEKSRSGAFQQAPPQPKDRKPGPTTKIRHAAFWYPYIHKTTPAPTPLLVSWEHFLFFFNKETLWPEISKDSGKQKSPIDANLLYIIYTYSTIGHTYILYRVEGESVLFSFSLQGRNLCRNIF